MQASYVNNLSSLCWALQTDYGGAQQYVEWNDDSNTSTIAQFYQDTTIWVCLLRTCVPRDLAWSRNPNISSLQPLLLASELVTKPCTSNAWH